MANRKCVVHIGYPKTGTTSIQSFLSQNDKRLLELGIYIPKVGRAGPHGGHHALMTDWVEGEQSNFATLGKLAAELAASQAKLAIISSELWSDCTLHKPRTMLFDAIHAVGWEVDVVLYFRALPAFVHSMYSEYVKQGGTATFDLYFSNCLKQRAIVNNGVTHSIDYLAYIEDLASDPNINVKPYSYHDASSKFGVLEHFLWEQASLRVEDVLGENVTPDWENNRHGPHLLETARIVNALRARIARERLVAVETVLVEAATIWDQLLSFGALQEADVETLQANFSESMAGLSKNWNLDLETTGRLIDTNWRGVAATRRQYDEALERVRALARAALTATHTQGTQRFEEGEYAPRTAPRH